MLWKLLMIIIISEVVVELTFVFLHDLGGSRFLKWILTGTMVTLCLILGAPTARVMRLVVLDRLIYS